MRAQIFFVVNMMSFSVKGVGKQSYILMGKKALSKPVKVQLVRAYMLMKMYPACITTQVIKKILL